MLWGLFFNAFLAASLWPLGVEPLYIYLLGTSSATLCLVVATAGNTLGSIFTFCMARYFPSRGKLLDKLGAKSKYFQKMLAWVNRYGHFTALLCWLPVIGDIIALALGFSKSSLAKSSVFIFVGKLVRFALINLIYFQFS